MKIQQIRNATLKVTYAGATFLIDPWLAGRWEMGCFADIPGAPFTVPDPAKCHIPMPICPLPLPESASGAVEAVASGSVEAIASDAVEAFASDASGAAPSA